MGVPFQSPGHPGGQSQPLLFSCRYFPVDLVHTDLSCSAPSPVRSLPAASSRGGQSHPCLGWCGAPERDRSLDTVCPAPSPLLTTLLLPRGLLALQTPLGVSPPSADLCSGFGRFALDFRLRPAVKVTPGPGASAASLGWCLVPALAPPPPGLFWAQLGGCWSSD